MRWELINSTAEHQVYHLFKDSQKILKLDINPHSNSARVEYNNEKRVFLIRKEGLRKSRIAIRNEYGVKVGELSPEQTYPDSLKEWCLSLYLQVGKEEQEPVTA